MARKRRSHRQGTLFKRHGRGVWVSQWYDHAGKRKFRSTGTTDRAAAERILAKNVADAALRREGVIDPRADCFAIADRRPLSEHVADWQAHLTAKDVTAKHVKHVTKRVEALVARISATRMSDLIASKVQTAVGELRTAGKSLQTCQHYLRAIKQFSRWLKRDGRVRDDGLVHLTGFNVATDRRYERRALDADELGWLVQTTETAPNWRHSLSGTNRAMLYRVAAGSGFRAGELASLTPTSFKLDADPPAIAIEALKSKRRRADLQPIRIDLADTLCAWLTDKPRVAPVWPGAWKDQAAEMIRSDLRRAKAGWIRKTQNRQQRRERLEAEFLSAVDSSGRVTDFHSLRVSYITLLVKSGASVKVAQELARHSTPVLTLGVYTKLGIHDLAGALGALPGLVSPPNVGPERIAIRATGTDHGRAADAAKSAMATYEPADCDDRSALQECRQKERETTRTGAASRIMASAQAVRSDTRNSLSHAEIREQGRRSAIGRDKATGRTRTVDLRFTKPLLCQLSYGGDGRKYIDAKCVRNATAPERICFILFAWGRDDSAGCRPSIPLPWAASRVTGRYQPVILRTVQI